MKAQKTLEICRDAVPEWHTQFTVYDRDNGRRVATVFTSESDAFMFKAAPALLAACKDAAERAAERADKDQLAALSAALAIAEVAAPIADADARPGLISRLKAIIADADHIATWTERDGLDRERLARIANNADAIGRQTAQLLDSCQVITLCLGDGDGDGDDDDLDDDIDEEDDDDGEEYDDDADEKADEEIDRCPMIGFNYEAVDSFERLLRSCEGFCVRLALRRGGALDVHIVGIEEDDDETIGGTLLVVTENNDDDTPGPRRTFRYDEIESITVY